DRAALFGIESLRENADFKKDITQVAAKTLSEEFTLRRTRILETCSSPEALVRKRRRIQFAKSISGWAVAAALITAFVFLQVNPTFVAQPTRSPASASVSASASLIGPQAR